MDYQILWRKLKKRLNYAKENAHPRFKHLMEDPTIKIKRVLEIMKEFEEGG